MAKRTGRQLYVVDVTGKLVHKPRAEGEECGPPAGATVGYAPDLGVLKAEGFSLCSVCFGQAPGAERVEEAEAPGEERVEEAEEAGEAGGEEPEGEEEGEGEDNTE